MLTAKKTLLLIACPLLFFSYINLVWSESVEKQTVLAVLTLNISRFTLWPEHIIKNTENTLNLCVFGDNTVQQSFENINQKIVKNKTINIINLSRLRKLKRCQLLYLSKLERSRLIPLLLELKGQPILTIGENMEFLQAGGMIGLQNIDGKIQLTINLPIVNQSDLIISSRLLKLAKIIDIPYQQIN